MKVLIKIYSRFVYVAVALVWLFLAADIIYKFMY